jgi:endonuclease-3 related protein
MGPGAVLLARADDPEVALPALYEMLQAYWGNLGWWPAESPFEVIVGAILTQNTAWQNVEKAVTALKRETVLSPARIRDLSEDRLAEWIRPAGYYRLKARRLKAFIRFLYERYAGNLDRMFAQPTERLREALLSVNGIGPETADSILLYAGGKPVFVVDAYTKRILCRHGMIPEGVDYATLQGLFTRHLPAEAPLFNQYHALLVHTGKTFCRKKPLCTGCPLEPLVGPGEAR